MKTTRLYIVGSSLLFCGLSFWLCEFQYFIDSCFDKFQYFMFLFKRVALIVDHILFKAKITMTIICVTVIFIPCLQKSSLGLTAPQMIGEFNNSAFVRIKVPFKNVVNIFLESMMIGVKQQENG